MRGRGWGLCLLACVLLVDLAAGKQDERERRKDIVDMAFCGEDDCYAVLNISSDSTRGEVKRGYHRMSLQYHPDKLGDKSEEEQAAGNAIFIKVAQAYAVLSDEESRRKYDICMLPATHRALLACGLTIYSSPFPPFHGRTPGLMWRGC